MSLNSRSISLFRTAISRVGRSKIPLQQQFLCRNFVSTHGYKEDDDRFEDNKPTIAYSKTLPRTFSQMRHEQIIQLCVEGSHEARREALIRNVMAVDNSDYDAATQKVVEMAKYNRKSMTIEYFPYHAGMGLALVTGVVSFPLIFHADTVIWFNDVFVTTDQPGKEDLQTFWEVGSWSWGWMEPAIGQASFFLLVLQFARSQSLKLGIKPYGDLMLSMRSERFIKKYPQYNTMFLEWFAESDALYGSTILDKPRIQMGQTEKA